MKAIKVLGMVSVVAMLSACAGGSASKGTDSEGNCTSDVVGAYNSVNHEINMFIIARDSKDSAKTVQRLQILKNACDQLYPSYANVSCKAEVNYKTETIDMNKHKEICDAAAEDIKKINSSQTAAETSAPVAAPTETDECSASFIADFREVAAEGEKTASIGAEDFDKLIKQLKNYVRTCDAFQVKHANVSCKVTVDSERKTLSGETAKKTCDSAKTILESSQGLQ